MMMCRSSHERLCTIDADRDELACWRSDGAGRLKEELAVQGEFSSVSAARFITCVLDAGGTGRCWGMRLGSVDKPTVVENAVQLQASDRGVCVLLEDGTLSCYGDTRPPPGLLFKSISRPVLFENACGITLDGFGYCWGDPSRRSGPLPVPQLAPDDHTSR